MTAPVQPQLARVARLCDDALAAGAAGSELDAVVRGLRDGLEEPVRVAVVGRVGAGKSTLVNALVGRRIAPTSAGECTRVVTWYRYGSPDRADLVLRDGSRLPLPIGEQLPEDLPVPLEQVERLEVRLQAGALRRLTLVDTPGLATLTAVHEAATRRAVLGEQSSTSAVSQVDAVVFLFREAERGQEVDFLREFLSASGELGATAVNALGVLSHADLLGDGPWGEVDPLVVAAEQAARLTRQRAAEVGVVLPVVGLMAETSRTGQLRESDARLLSGLAATDGVRLRLWEQLGPPEGVDEDGLRRLLRLLGPYGLARGRGRGAADRLLAWLEDCSGVARLEAVLQSRFVDRQALLRADRTLTVLERAADPATLAPGLVAVLRELVEQARAEPVLHPLRELRALGLLARHAPDSPLVGWLEALLDGGPAAVRLGLPADEPLDRVLAQARRRSAEAQAAATLATGSAEADAARTTARSYLLLARAQQPVAAAP